MPPMENTRDGVPVPSCAMRMPVPPARQGGDADVMGPTPRDPEEDRRSTAAPVDRVDRHADRRGGEHVIDQATPRLKRFGALAAIAMLAVACSSGGSSAAPSAESSEAAPS